jgi:hypothetical protein
MIIFFNNQPVTKEVKIKKLFERAQILYGSDYFDIQDERWLGDNLTIESLFPSWILKKYEENPEDVFVIPIIKNYFRWLLSINQGYGAQLEWENLRCGLFTNQIFLEAWANYYFPYADFSSTPLKEKLPNIRKFSINSDLNYFNIKGTPAAIKYVLCTLFDFSISSINVETANAGIISLKVDSSDTTELEKYKTFIEEYLISAGTTIIYGVN